jgi:hypothetical protein
MFIYIEHRKGLTKGYSKIKGVLCVLFGLRLLYISCIQYIIYIVKIVIIQYILLFHVMDFILYIEYNIF